MSSKQLGTILKNAPSATAKGEELNLNPHTTTTNYKNEERPIEYTRIVASIPQLLKDEIREYLKENKTETETTVVLKSLQKMGFHVHSSWIVDKRRTR